MLNERMETIRAAHNLTIELGPTTWRLLNGTHDPDDPDTLVSLVEAREGQLICAPIFARARQLPGEQLAPADIARVVVGWAPESRNWHLGLLLAARPESGYKMRWCGLASWPSGPATDHMVPAKLAGQSLARIIDRPFHLVPAAKEGPSSLSDTQVGQATVQMDLPDEIAETALPQVALQPAPFEFETWSLLSVPKGYLWQRRGKWLMATFVQALMFAALGVLFLILGVGSRTRGLAPVNPDWLPSLGLAVAAVMELIALHNLRKLLIVRDVLVDTTQNEVRCQGRFTRRIAWRVPFEDVRYLVLSQTPAQALGRKQKDGPMRTAQEVWLHLYDGRRFREVAALGRVEGLCHAWDVVRKLQKVQGRRRLHLGHYDTPAHHATLVMAGAISTEAWLDIR